MKTLVKFGNGDDCNVRRPGRPRCERARRAILAAAMRFLERKGNGFADLTIEHVAAEAGVGKATVYRWWPNKTSLVIDAFAEFAELKLRYPDTGSVTDDMCQQMQQLAKLMASRRGHMLSVILAAGQSDEGLMRAFRERFVVPRRKEAAIVLQRAIDRGELPAQIDFEFIMDSLYGALYLRFMVWQKAPTQEYVAQLSRLVLEKVKASGGMSKG